MSGEPNACAASSINGTPSDDELRERRRPAEQVHGEDRLRPSRDPSRHVLGIEVHRRGVDVGEDRRRAAARDRLCGRVERESRADDLVAGADPHGVHARARARPCRWRRRRSRARRDTRPPPARTRPRSGPRMNSALASTPSIASRMRGRSGSYCAFTSTSGIGRTIRQSRRPFSRGLAKYTTRPPQSRPTIA